MAKSEMTGPLYRDIPYGPHARNVLDLYRPDTNAQMPLYVYIHGGGFRAGDKSTLPPVLLEACLKSGIAVGAINYRLSGTDPYPAAMLDSTRALQFLRYKAKEWHLDATRVAAGGGSAGGGITFWIGFRKDLAKPKSKDPVERQSTRLTCIASWNTQTSYDMNYIRTIISGSAYIHSALKEFFKVSEAEMKSPRAQKQFDETSALKNVSKSAPPTFLWYSGPDRPMNPDLAPDQGIHHPKFGQLLKARMDELGVECVLRQSEDASGLQPEELKARFYREAVEFVKRQFRIRA